MEAMKLQQHLSLLKQEYSKLQADYRDLKQKYEESAAASSNDSGKESFASRLLQIISGLYNSETYSDIKIKLSDREVHSHKLVLNGRSKLWSEAALSTDCLDWTDIDADVANAIIQWLYSSEIKLQSDELTLKLIRQAFAFRLSDLVQYCEKHLINIVNIRNCVRIYSVAEETEANCLRDYCSELISIYWDELNSSDFEHMSGPLLYDMLKNKTQLPLHSAVRLQREDVVFLCLVENSSKVRFFYA